jgi:hypothetical protein
MGAHILAITITVIVIVSLISLTVWSIRKRSYRYLCAVALRLVIEAENKFEIEGQKTGTTKYGWVAKEILKYMPNWMKQFVPATLLEEIIENAVTKMKQLLAAAAQHEDGLKPDK